MNNYQNITLDWNDILLPSLEETKEEAKDTVSVSTSTPVEDALLLSLNYTNTVNLDYIAGITGLDKDEVLAALKGVIFQNPETWEENPYKGWETKDEYLSGNLKEKLQAAKNAQAEHGCFQPNVDALDALLPDELKEDEIYVTLGSPWLPAHIIDDFISYLFKPVISRSYWRHITADYMVKHDNLAWEVPHKERYGNSAISVKTYGTGRINALWLLEMTLNMKTAAVYDEVPSLVNKSGIAKVLNEGETLLAIEKQKLLIRTFQDWVWKDPNRSRELIDIYQRKYACIQQRVYDGSYLTFPGMNPEVQLYPYQKNAVLRIITSPNTLLAHEVGAGKTYTMAAAGMKLKSLGLSKKNMYVVPNNIVGQWKKIFLNLFPEAEVLCIEPDNFKPAVRQNVLARIRDNEYDAVIIAYSCFNLIPLSKSWYINEMKEEKKSLEALCANRKKSTSALKAKLKKVTADLLKLTASGNNTLEMICFDELGVTRLFIDEAHNFKNIPLYGHGSFMNNGHSNGSAKCRHMLEKVHHVQAKTNGGGVVMATGTPVTNSISEIFVMQQYLQSGELTLLDLQTIDAWVGMFAERSAEFEIDVDTNNCRLGTRLTKLHNIPELTDIIASFTDFHKVDAADGIPVLDGYDDIVLKKPAILEDYMKEISARTEKVRKRQIRRRDDNLLKITTDGRKAALDIRLVKTESSPSEQSKVKTCAEIIFGIYLDSEAETGTQLVFCDASTPKAGFNLYDELKNLLVGKGIPENKIAFIHEAKTEASKEKLFARMRQGEIRILIGSTPKLGLGVNVQEHLVALHHLDIPWRPSDMKQREGRILRKGNLNSKVRIFRYAATGSFDVYSWQLLERKQRFIDDILSGTALSRSADDDSQNTALSYAEIKALAIGNPKIRERIDTANELHLAWAPCTGMADPLCWAAGTNTAL